MCLTDFYIFLRIRINILRHIQITKHLYYHETIKSYNHFHHCSTISFSTDAKQKDQILNYDIEGAGTGAQGTYMVKVTVISKDKKPKEDLIKRSAVHGVLFRGFASKEMRQNQKPLAGSATNEAQHADFYKDFFAENGTATAYAQIVTGSREVVKAGKEYRVSDVVIVNKDQLLKDLQAAGVIRGLNSGF